MSWTKTIINEAVQSIRVTVFWGWIKQCSSRFSSKLTTLDPHQIRGLLFLVVAKTSATKVSLVGVTLTLFKTKSNEKLRGSAVKTTGVRTTPRITRCKQHSKFTDSPFLTLTKTLKLAKCKQQIQKHPNSQRWGDFLIPRPRCFLKKRKKVIQHFKPSRPVVLVPMFRGLCWQETKSCRQAKQRCTLEVSRALQYLHKTGQSTNSSSMATN